MTTPQTLWIVVAAIAMLFWLLFAVSGARKPTPSNLVAVLRYGILLRIFALILTLAPLILMVVLVWALHWRDNATLAAAGISFVASSLLAGLLLLETTAVQIFLTDDGISRCSFWTGLETLKWSEVERVRYSTLNRWIVVMGAGKTIRVSRHMDGLPIFVETLKRKIASERYAAAAEVLDRLK